MLIGPVAPGAPLCRLHQAVDRLKNAIGNPGLEPAENVVPNIDALRLSRMITEMLDLDRIESGRMTRHLSEIDMPELITAAVERAQASTSKHRISVRCEHDVPRISGGSDRLSQVMAKVLSNAVKYSPDGGDITVSLLSDATGLSIVVEDQGLGIPADYLGRVFEKYECYESSATDRPASIYRRVVRHSGSASRGRSPRGRDSLTGSTAALPVHSRQRGSDSRSNAWQSK